MNTNVVTFEDSVKERLKSIVAELIPEERWEGIVKATVLEFERVDLPKLVKAELEKKFKEAIEAEFRKPEWQGRFGDMGEEASAAVHKLLVESAPVILASLFGGAMQNVVQQLKNAIQYRSY